MKQALAFIAPMQDSTQSGLQREMFDKAVELYEQQKPVEALHALLDGLNAELRTKYGDAAGREFHIPHGSIVVHMSIKEESLDIDADFLKLPESGRVAMLRQVADLNINQLRLARFVKQGDNLKIVYSCLLTEAYPYKILGVLSNICSIGDRYDDEFCTKFSAERCYEPRITPYPAEKAEQIIAAIKSQGQAVQAAVREYNAQRKYVYSWYLLYTLYYQICYFANPQGQLANDLDKIMCDMDEELQYAELVARGEAFLDRLLATPAEKIAADLYFIDKLVPTKRASSLQSFQENLEQTADEAAGALEAEDFERVVIKVAYKFYQAYYFNDMQDDLNAIISGALRKSAGKPLDQAAEILAGALVKIMDDDLTPDVDMDELLAAAPGAQQMVEQAATAAAAMQQKAAEMLSGTDMQTLQQKMAEAMMRGDMAEYMRLAGEMQQMMMSGMFKM